MKLTKSKASRMIDCLYDHILEESGDFIENSRKYNEKSFVWAIDEYLEPEPKKDTILELFLEYVHTLQNSSMMPYVIKFGEIDRGFLLNFNCKKIVDIYGNSTTRLLRAVKQYNIHCLEQKHRQGYAVNPVNREEFSIWEEEQNWGDE